MKIKIVAIISLITWFAGLHYSQASPIRVACVGNSVTFGAGIAKVEDNYPSQLQRMLGDDYMVGNFGHSGATLLNNGYKPYQNLPEYKDALLFNPDIVIIHLGLNDTDPRNWPYYRDEFVSDYTALIDSFRTVNPEAEIKICRMTPIFPQHRRFKSSTRDWYWQIQDAIDVVAKINKLDLIDLNTPLYNRSDLFPDALHPTKDGATIIAEKIYGHITKNFGGLKMPNFFTSDMVIQRNEPIVFWGTTNGASSVEVNFDGQHKRIIAKNDGSWEIDFPPMKAGGPYRAIVTSENSTFELNNILIGDVWVCSGQSNMEFKLKDASTAHEDIKSANYPEIRLLNMQPIAYTNNSSWEGDVLSKVNSLNYLTTDKWEECTPESALNFSAIAYHFGKTVYENTDVPLGLILNAVGGSPTESWIDRYSIEHHDRLVDMFINWGENDFIHPWVRSRAALNVQLGDNKVQQHPYHPSYMYSASIQSLSNFPITGAIWYQGESNEQNVELHEVIFEELISSWRRAWNKDFPFYFVQLSGMGVGRETWGHFRDSQRRLSQSISNIGMAVSFDMGDRADVHPKNKKPIGERLAFKALHDTYGLKDIIHSGPDFKYAKLDDSVVIVHFDFSSGLSTSDNMEVRGFEIAEYPGVYYPADAKIVGETVVVTCDETVKPRYIRYGWKSYSDANLINKANLPSSTFSAQVE